MCNVFAECYGSAEFWNPRGDQSVGYCKEQVVQFFHCMLFLKSEKLDEYSWGKKMEIKLLAKNSNNLS